MKNPWIRKTLTVVLTAACVMTAGPAASFMAWAAETDLAAVQEAELTETADSVPETAEPVPEAAVSEMTVEDGPVTVPETQEAAVPAVTETAEAETAVVPNTGETEIPADSDIKEAETADGSVPAAAEASSEETAAGETAAEEMPAEEAQETEAEEELEQADEEAETPVVSYCTHVQTHGWMEYVSDGEMAGTTGEAKRLEGIRIKVSGVEGLGIEYNTHIQKYGWRNYVADDAISGTTGEAKRLEAIRIRLTGEKAADYDVYYCVHVQTYGWLNWAKNDQMSGTAGYSKRLEGIRIQILPKGSPAPVSVAGAVSSFLDNTGNSSIGENEYGIIYNTHVQTYGWQDWVGDGAPAGTSGQSKRLEGLHVLLQNQDVSGSVEYRTHVQGIGWQDWVKDGAMAGTTGQAKRLEALQIRLTGEMAQKYDIWYRTHVQHFGWRGWAKNGEEAGSQGYSYRMEAIEIKLLPKGSEAPGSTADAFSVATIRDLYPLACERLDQIGWDLRSAFIWSASMPYYRLPQDISYGARFFATYGFQNGQGDCYVMAACFYEMAKALGYDAHWMFGYVPMARGGLGVHSWVEIVYNGATYICDPDYTHESGGNGYMITYGAGGWGYYYITRMN